MRGEIVKKPKAKFKEFLQFYKTFSKPLVMKKVKISHETYVEFYIKAVELEKQKEIEEQKVFAEKQPMSHNEDDYGTKMPFLGRYALNKYICKFNRSAQTFSKKPEIVRAIAMYKNYVVNERDV